MYFPKTIQSYSFFRNVFTEYLLCNRHLLRDLGYINKQNGQGLLSLWNLSAVSVNKDGTQASARKFNRI